MWSSSPNLIPNEVAHVNSCGVLNGRWKGLHIAGLSWKIQYNHSVHNTNGRLSGGSSRNDDMALKAFVGSNAPPAAEYHDSDFSWEVTSCMPFIPPLIHSVCYSRQHRYVCDETWWSFIHLASLVIACLTSTTSAQSVNRHLPWLPRHCCCYDFLNLSSTPRQYKAVLALSGLVMSFSSEWSGVKLAFC